MNETLINLLKKNRVQKVAGERGRGKKIPSGTVVYEQISQEEQQPDPLRQCNNLAKPSKTEKCADWVQCDICDEYICPKIYDKRERETDRQKQRQRQRQRDRERQRETETETDREGQRETETETDRETERDRKRQKESFPQMMIFFCSICIGS